MSSFGILGSGFGLYGYLPALAYCKQSIIMPRRYYERFVERLELTSFMDGMKWADNEQTLIQTVSGIVLALPPKLQSEYLLQTLSLKKVKYLLLEKPLANSPKAAAISLEQLRCANKIFRIGYIFRYTDWGKHLLTTLKAQHGTDPLEIKWYFMAHHFSQNKPSWKRRHSDGGGVIRFYGIQIIALLAEIGYRNIRMSQTFGLSIDACERWRAIFSGNGLPDCEVVIDSKSKSTQFQVQQTLLTNPFDSNANISEKPYLDQRVSILNEHCLSLWETDSQPYEWYEAAINLWQAVEDNNTFDIHTSNAGALTI